MTHKKVLGKELSSKIERASVAQLRMMLIMILVMLGKKGRLTKSQRKSLAITESEMGIRKGVLREKGEMKGPGKKGGKRKGPPKGKVPPQLRPYLFKKGHRKVRKK